MAKKRQSVDLNGKKIPISVELEPRLHALVARDAEVEDRGIASMVRIILKRHYAEELFSEDLQKQPQDKLGGLHYYGDNETQSSSGGAG